MNILKCIFNGPNYSSDCKRSFFINHWYICFNTYPGDDNEPKFESIGNDGKLKIVYRSRFSDD